MNKHDLRRIIKRIAKENNMMPEEVRYEMQSAMEAGQNNPDPAIRAKWNAIPHKGHTLTLEEFIEFVAKKASLYHS